MKQSRKNRLHILVTIHLCCLYGFSTSVPRDIMEILWNKSMYDRHATPTQYSDEPTNVSITMYIEGISSFTASSMDFHVDIYFQELWMDKRLQHSNKERILIKDYAIFDAMWHPDLYFANARQAEYHYVTAPNFLVWIWPNGTVYLDTRVSLTVMCMMDLAKYPLDTQRCDIRILSYAYTQEQLMIFWRDQVAPISKNPKIKLPDMHLVKIDSGYCDGNYEQGVWSCALALFTVRREIMHHILQSYIPTALIVVISWFSFWLDVDAVPGRVSLCITTLLTLATQASAARLALPQVSYIKAIDIWMGTCMAYVFGVMIEFTFVNYLSRRKTCGGGLGFGKIPRFGEGKKVGEMLPIQLRRNMPQTTALHSPIRALNSTGFTPRSEFPPAIFTENCVIQRRPNATISIGAHSETDALSESNPWSLADKLPPGTTGYTTISHQSSEKPGAHSPPDTPSRQALRSNGNTNTFNRNLGGTRWTSIANSIANSRNPLPGDPIAERVQIRQHSRKMAQRIDRYCRAIFPITFAIFNIFYWVYYTYTPDTRLETEFV